MPDDQRNGRPRPRRVRAHAALGDLPEWNLADLYPAWMRPS